MLYESQASLIRAYLAEYEGVDDDWCPEWQDYAPLLIMMRELLNQHDEQVDALAFVQAESLAAKRGLEPKKADEYQHGQCPVCSYPLTSAGRCSRYKGNHEETKGEGFHGS